MTQINECKSEMMSAKKVDVLAVKANEQGSEFVHPGKTAFTGETSFVDDCVEEAFTSPFGLFRVTLVLADVRNDAVIETDFAGFERIKGAAGVEVGSGNRQSQALHATKGSLKVGFEVESIMMVACDNSGRSHHVAERVSNGQDIRGFGAFSVLVGDTFSAFLRQRMATIEIQLRQIEFSMDGLNTLLPNSLQTTVSAPFLKVIVDSLPAYLFFSGSFREGAIGNCVH